MNQMMNLSFSERTKLNNKLSAIYDGIRRDLMVMEFEKIDLSEEIIYKLQQVKEYSSERTTLKEYSINEA